MWWGGDAWGWVKEEASEIRDFVQRPEFALWTGHVEDPPLWGAGREYMPESVLVITDKINDPRVSTGLLVGIGIPGKTGWVKCSDEISGMTIPLRARNIAQYVKSKGAPPQGYKGGTVFENQEGKLPIGGKYKEYDIQPHVKGFPRGPERVVIDETTGKSWYTNDHYGTFIPID